MMYTLNTGWIILFADTPQAVYDMNLCALKIAESVRLPVIVAFDGFFTSHQKKKSYVFEEDETVTGFLGKQDTKYSVLDLEHPVSIGSYMNEPDILNNKYQLHQAMEQARVVIPQVFREYAELSGRDMNLAEGYRNQDAQVILFLLGSSYHTAKTAADRLREQGSEGWGCDTSHTPAVSGKGALRALQERGDDFGGRQAGQLWGRRRKYDSGAQSSSEGSQ